jgi:hypothetical protein
VAVLFLDFNSQGTKLVWSTQNAREKGSIYHYILDDLGLDYDDLRTGFRNYGLVKACIFQGVAEEIIPDPTCEEYILRPVRSNSTLHSPLDILHSPLSALHFPLYSPLSTLHSLVIYPSQDALYTPHRTRYTPLTGRNIYP